MIGIWTTKQEGEIQESSDDKETECDYMMLKQHVLTLNSSANLTSSY